MKTEKLTKQDAYNFAKEMIRVYVERGDTIRQLKSGQLGCTLGEQIGYGSIGGLYGQKKRSTDYIVIEFNGGEIFEFKLKNIFEAIKNENKQLF